jgi:hypothetical protein
VGRITQTVMAGLVPAIYVDPRDSPGIMLEGELEFVYPARVGKAGDHQEIRIEAAGE